MQTRGNNNNNNNNNRIDENVVEVQRKHPTRGEWSAANLTEEDGPPFFNTRTGAAVSSLDDAPLPIGWSWAGNWKPQIDRPGADLEGFIVDENKPAIRRRWWKRPRERVASQANVISSSSSSSPASNAVNPVLASSSSNPFLSPSSHDSVLLDTSATTFASSASSLPPRAEESKSPEDQLRLVTNTIRKLNSINQKLASEVNGIDDDDDGDVREKEIEEGRGLVEEGRRALSLIPETSASIRVAKMKLSGELERDAKRFETMAERLETRRLRNKRYGSGGNTPSLRQQQLVSSASSSTHTQKDEDVATREFEEGFQRLQSQQLAVSKVMDQVEYNEIVIRTRNAEIKDVAKMAATVNGMMTDLAKMVDEQGDDIKKIKAQTKETNTVMAKGLVEVEKADKYQQDGGSCVTC